MLRILIILGTAIYPHVSVAQFTPRSDADKAWKLSQPSEPLAMPQPVLEALARLPEDVKKSYAEAIPELTRAAAPRIVFVPGILGSKIDECQAGGSQCKSIWGTVQSFASNVDLSLRADRRYRTDVVDSFLFSEVYGGLLDAIRREAVRLGPENPNDPILTVFHYDWRRSASDNALALSERVCAVTKAAPNAPLVIVSHSMGGLVSKVWAKRHAKQECLGGQAPNLTRMVFVATPHLGSPKTVKSIVDGYNILFDELNGLARFFSWTGFEVEAQLREMLGPNGVLKSLNSAGPTFPSIYELLPIKSSADCQKKKPGLHNNPDILNAVDGDNGAAIDIFKAKAWVEYDLLRQIGPSAIRQEFYAKSLPGLLRNL